MYVTQIRSVGNEAPATPHELRRCLVRVLVTNNRRRFGSKQTWRFKETLGKKPGSKIIINLRTERVGSVFPQIYIETLCLKQKKKNSGQG